MSGKSEVINEWLRSLGSHDRFFANEWMWMHPDGTWHDVPLRPVPRLVVEAFGRGAAVQMVARGSYSSSEQGDAVPQAPRQHWMAKTFGLDAIIPPVEEPKLHTSALRNA